jgi:hypothetical protein
MSTVFFLGAGASVDAGYPLTSDLLVVLESKYSTTAFTAMKESWKSFRKFVKEPRGYYIRSILDSNNPELILTLPDLLEAALGEFERSSWKSISEQLKNNPSRCKKILKKYGDHILTILY